MMIDIMKIGKIKTKKQLAEYKINKPIFNNNYLFHYLILTNNITALKLTKYPIDMMNDDNMNGFMLAASQQNYVLLVYFIKTYPEFIYCKNNNNMNFLHYLEPTNKLYYNIINGNNLKWYQLFSTYSILHISPLDLLFMNGTYNNISKVIHNKINYSNYTAHSFLGSYQSQPSFFNIFINMNLTTLNIISILDTLYNVDNMIFTYTDDMGYNISFVIILKNDILLAKYIVKKCGTSLDNYSPLLSSHIFTISYMMGVKNNNYKIPRLIYKIMKNHDFNETDMSGNNIVHMILYSRIKNNKGDPILEDKILSSYNDWTKINMMKISPLDLMVGMDFYVYHKYIKKINIKKKDLNKIKSLKWRKYISKLPQYTKDNKRVVMIKAPYSHSNMFQAHFTDIAIFCFYLKNKYKMLYLPQYNGNYETSWPDDIILPDYLLEEYNNFPWLIVWNNSSNYWIHPHLNQLILDNMELYSYAFIILSLRLPNDGLHATMIFYDFKRKIVERFDPYGNTTQLDRDMDKILEEELTWNTGLKYIAPNVYFPVSGFQTISDENNINNTKLGDFGGYCLAWCFWYVEHRLLNKNVDPFILVRKTLNRFMEMNIKPMEYIRNYANYINRYRVKFFKKSGLDDMIASNENLTSHNKITLFKSIISTNSIL